MSRVETNAPFNSSSMRLRVRDAYPTYMVADCLLCSFPSSFAGLMRLDAPALFNWGSACDCVCLVKCGGVGLQFEMSVCAD